MRVLGVGLHNDLGALYQRLMARGHEVRVSIGDPDSADILEGLVPRSADWRRDVAWVSAAGAEGLVVFEGTGWGAEQEALRRDGVRVVGGSALGDRLELDRAFGQNMLARAGLKTAATHEFHGFAAGLAFLEKNPARYVLKFSGAGFASTRNYVGVLPDGDDVRAVLTLQKARWAYDEVPSFVLMEHLEGVEVGVGGFFDGERFLAPVNLDWEHKRFFPGDLGELTGEMGTLVTYRGAERLFEATLARLSPELRASGYVGYVNLNLIVNDRGAWPLELTCRFGYPGFAILGALHEDPWDVVLAKVVDRSAPSFATRDGYAVGLVVTAPPFPYPDGYSRLSKGMPICFRKDLTDDDREHLHYGEVKSEGGVLVTAGQIGYVMVVTGCGETPAEARLAANARAAKVVVPNGRYRLDIGEAFERRGAAELARLGWLAPEALTRE